jgi:hypothetical protein
MLGGSTKVRKTFSKFTAGRVQVCLTLLDAATGCRPEYERLVVPFYNKSDQKHLLRGV